MNKSHTVCKECIANHYWHHMDDRKRFFKVLMGDFKNGLVRHIFYFDGKPKSSISESKCEHFTL